MSPRLSGDAPAPPRTAASSVWAAAAAPLLLVGVGCASPPPPRPPSPDAHERLDPSGAGASAARSDSGAPPGRSVDPGELLEAPPSASPPADEAGAEPDAGPFDVERWAREVGVVAELDAESCELAGFSGPKVQAIWCERVEENEADRIATTLRTLYVARDASLAKIADVATATGPLDLPPGATDADRYWVKLVVQAAPDGSVSFVDSPEVSCEAGRTKNAEFGQYVPDQAARRGQAIDRVCGARGRWVWSAGSLRRTTRPAK